MYRIGFGIDFHRWAEGRKCKIGGVEIPYHKGLDGHSDADVLLHAICDALLGALALGDIGVHFPNQDAAFKDIDSAILLQRSYALIRDKNYVLVNVDSTVCAEQPLLNPHIPQMQEKIAALLKVPKDCISIKATTTEKLGFVGREEGIVAHAVILLQNNIA